MDPPPKNDPGATVLMFGYMDEFWTVGVVEFPFPIYIFILPGIISIVYSYYNINLFIFTPNVFFSSANFWMKSDGFFMMFMFICSNC
jgi:hypothetical protein